MQFRLRSALKCLANITSYKKPDRLNSGSRMCFYETLEDRCMMANLNLGIQLWTVGFNNSKGTLIQPISANSYQVTINTPFFVQVLADDAPGSEANRTSAGIVGLPLDLKWNSGATDTARAIQYAGTSPETFPTKINISNPILNSAFDFTRLVNAFDINGNATQLRGATIAGGGIGKAGVPSADGKDGNREFGLLRFNPVSLGTTSFEASLNGSMSFADAARLDNVPTTRATISILAAGGLSSLSGYVYADANKDSTRNLDASGSPIEIGIPNVTIRLFIQGAVDAIVTTTTGPDGWYQFENLQPGSYRIVETQPSGFRSTGNSLGKLLPSNTSSGFVGTDEFTNIQLAAAQNGVDNNFGEVFSASSISKRMLLASAPPMEVLIAQRMGVSSSAISGTSGNDTITVNASPSSIQVFVNSDPVQTFPVGSGKVLFLDSRGGEDTVTINDSNVAELAHFQPSYVGLRRNDFALVGSLSHGIVAKGAEHLIVNSGTSQSSAAVIQDGPGNDAVTTDGKRTSIVWANSGASAQVASYGRVKLIKSLGGVDSVNERSRDFVLERYGDWI